MKQKKIENKNHKIDNNDKRERNMEIMKCQKRGRKFSKTWDGAWILLPFYLSNLSNVFVQIVKCICPNYKMYLSKL